MNNRKENDYIEIDLLKLMQACLKKWWLIALVTAFTGAAAFFYTYQFITPTYQSTVKLYVNNSSIDSSSSTVSNSDITASTNLVSVYEAILDTRDTLERVIEQAGLDYTYEKLSKMLSTSSVNSTQVFQVVVTSTSPEEAWLIASTIGDVLPEMIGNIIASSDTRIVENAVIPTQKSSPSYSKNTLLGAFAGCFLVVMIIVILELLDTTIRREDDFIDIVEVPVLAYIPDFRARESKRYGYGYGKYGAYGSYSKAAGRVNSSRTMEQSGTKQDSQQSAQK